MLKMAKEIQGAKHDKPKKKVKKEKTIDLNKAYGSHRKKKGFFTKIKEAFGKMPKGKRTIIISLISVITVLVLLLGTAFGYGCFLYCDIKGSYNYNNEVDGDQELQNIKPINEEITNIMVDELYGDVFHIVCGNTSKYPAKPDPASTLSVMERLGVKPQECVFIGDSCVDMQTAVNSGAFPVGETWGFRSEEELLENGAKYIIHTPCELLTVIDKINEL